MAYCVMNVDKQGRAAVYGLQIEANRTREDKHEFDLSDIDKSRTEQNYYLAKTDHWNKEITRQIKAAGVKERKDSIVLITGVYTASPEWFENHTREEMEKYFQDCLDFHVKEYCQNNPERLLNAVVHLDEKTPHLQVASLPLIADEKGLHLSAKIVMGNRSTYRLRQDRFYEEVGRKHDLERGERRDPAQTKEHTTKREWQLAKQEEQLQDTLEKTLEAQKDLENTNKELEQAREIIKPQIEAYNVISKGAKEHKKPTFEKAKEEVKDGLLRSHEEHFVKVPCKDEKEADRIIKHLDSLYEKNFSQEALNELILSKTKDLEKEKRKQQRAIAKAQRAFNEEKEKATEKIDLMYKEALRRSEAYSDLDLSEYGFDDFQMQSIINDSVTEELVRDTVRTTLDVLEQAEYLKKRPDQITEMKLARNIGKSFGERFYDFIDNVREHIAGKLYQKQAEKDKSDDLTL